MYNFRLSNFAKDDLVRTYHYGLKNFGMPQAEKYFEGFFNCFDSICKNPFMYPQIDNIKTGYRKCTYGVDTIYFKIENKYVDIVKIIGRQNFIEVNM